jgi:pyridoxine 4-dehydrogenase
MQTSGESSMKPLASRAAGFALAGHEQVDRVGFGAMRVTGDGVWGPPADKAEALAVLRTAVARGVSFIDTADSYGPNVSEELIAEALHPYRPGLVIATKGGLLRPGPSRWERDCRPEHLEQACEGSLRRLRTDCIDLYQLHAVDARVPLEDSVGALVDLQRAGKIRHIGLCNVNVEQLARARKLAKIVSVQNRYSLDDRASEAVLGVCNDEQLAFLPWYPLGSGRLTRDERLMRVARRRGATAAQVALAWLLDHAPVTVIIPGTSKLDHLEENLATRNVGLAPEDRAELDAIGAATAG